MIVSDNFDRADQQGLGVTPQGQTWMITGSGYQTVAIESHQYVDGVSGVNNTSYAGLQMAQQPIRIGGKFSLSPGQGNASHGEFALISSNDTGIQLKNMVHLNSSMFEVGLTWWQGSNQYNQPASCTGTAGYSSPLLLDGTTYSIEMTIVGNTVTVDKPDGTQYICTDPHLSQLAGTLGIWELDYNSTSDAVPRWDEAEAFVVAQ